MKAETKDAGPAGVEEPDSDLHSKEMLYLAAEEGLDEIVKGILSPACTKRGGLAVVFGHAIRRAAGNGHLSIMKKLLSAGGRLDVRSTDEDFLHQTCLHVAAARGHETAIRLIMAMCKERQVRRVSGLRCIAVCGTRGGCMHHVCVCGAVSGCVRPARRVRANG